MKAFVTLVTLVTSVQCLIQDVPGVYGPVLSISANSHPIEPYLKSRPSDFIHPGMWHSNSDLERMRTSVEARTEPWASTFDKFKLDQYSQANYSMKGPHAVLSRGRISNFTDFSADARAAWQNALMWYITRDHAHWDRSTTILDAWGSNLTDIIGTDRSLLIGLDGDIFVNAAEIMRHEGNWTESGSKWQGSPGFSNQLYWLFSRQSVVVGQANYGVASIKAMLNFAVYLDDVQLWNYAVSELVNHPCAGVFASYHPETGQSVEAGRDQGHTQSGIGWTAYAMRTAKTQGFDLYGLGHNLLLKAAEYAAKFNLNGTVSYDAKWFRCEAILVGGPWKDSSKDSFGIRNGIPIWDHLYYEYVVRRGLKAPWTTKARVAEGDEGTLGTSTPNDHPGWGGLIWAV